MTPSSLALFAAASVALGAESELGATLPDSATKVGELRYRTTQSLEETMKFYKSVYPAAAYPRKTIANQPGVKAVHISNPSKKGWEGLNIYQAVYEGNDEVRIYVVPSAENTVKKRAKTKK